MSIVLLKNYVALNVENKKKYKVNMKKGKPVLKKNNSDFM